MQQLKLLEQVKMAEALLSLQIKSEHYPAVHNI